MTAEAMQPRMFTNEHREAVGRIRSEYLEMPGMRLTAAQVQRLCGLDAITCDAVMEFLIAARFLARNTDGTYIRNTDESTRYRTLKADLSRPPRSRRAG